MGNVAVIGLQWGDEGKGKIVDYLSNRVDVVVRFQGGSNAGHTIVVDEKSYKLSLLPSGIIRGKEAIIGCGVVLDIDSLFNEIEILEKAGIFVTEKILRISDACPIVFNFYKEQETKIEELKGKTKIGTTNRGIGQTYEDNIGRRAIRVCHLYGSQSDLREMLEQLVFYHNLIRKSLQLELLDSKSLMKELQAKGEKLKRFVVCNDEISSCTSGKKVMYEGAQGFMLDINYGTYPYVTSSNTISGQIECGSSVGAKNLDSIIGVVKAYSTRVGSGPFVTEDFGGAGEKLQHDGAEFGTVTGRKRRCGWLDLVALKSACKFSGATSIALTKVDVLDEMDEINVCVEYELGGKVIDFVPSSSFVLKDIKPVYKAFKGWKESTCGIENFGKLPDGCKDYILFIESELGVKIELISTGAKRNCTIER